MPDEQIDKEIAAIKSVLEALDPLQPEIRQNVLDYVVRRLKIVIKTDDRGRLAPTASAAAAGEKLGAGTLVVPPVPPASDTPVHIKAFKEQKNPSSAAEMSAIVAYYLANLVPDAQRKERVAIRDIESYFKIAEYPLPKKVEMTLVNAKAAGYFDSVGNGEYKLNAVGYNLVSHNLPRGAGAPHPARHAPIRKNRRPVKRR